jgi:hypothetical protein
MKDFANARRADPLFEIGTMSQSVTASVFHSFARPRKGATIGVETASSVDTLIAVAIAALKLAPPSKKAEDSGNRLRLYAGWTDMLHSPFI